MSDLDSRMLARAVALGRKNMEHDVGGPFGSVIAVGETVIAEGANEVTSANDPTAHAEVVAIRRAGQALGTFNLSGHVLYASCEPCPMCLAAAYWARVDRIVFASTRFAAADIGFDDAFLYDEVLKPIEARSIPTVRHPLGDADELFAAWLAKADRIPY